MTVERDNGTLRILLRRNYALGVGISLLAGFVLLIGVLALATGQYFPHMTSRMTGLWAFAVGLVLAGMGALFTGTRDLYELSAEGLTAHHSRWRVITWSQRVPRSELQDVLVRPQDDGRGYCVEIRLRQRPPVAVSHNLPAEEAWHLASMMAEVTFLSVQER